jgi:hypothetical protein
MTVSPRGITAATHDRGDPALASETRKRLGRARDVLASPDGHSRARLRRACLTILRALPDTPAHTHERRAAWTMLSGLTGPA